MKRLLLPALVCGVVLAGLAFAGPAGAATFSNTAAITINDGVGCDPQVPAPASPYPSQIAVSGLSGAVTDVNVTLNGLTHTFPDDVGVVLVGPGPGGQTTILMADTGDGSDVTGVNLTFDDAAAASLPSGSSASSVLVSGTYKPTVGNPGACRVPSSFPAPAPAGPYGSALSVFNGTAPNGTWSLYVIDESTVDAGEFSGGWSLDITTTAVAARLLGAPSATRSGGATTVRWRTASEVGTVGYNVYREVNGRRARANARPIAAGRRAYTFVDLHARRGALARYWVQAVEADGSRIWLGRTRAVRT